jgi:peptidyl-prolyl cis-trans isomerase SurA
MKPILRFLLFAVALWLSCHAAQAELASGINAIVHDSVITYQEVEVFALPAVDAARRQYRSDPDGFDKKMNSIRTNSLDQLLERQLIIQDFHDSGYNIPESLIDESIKERIHERYGDRKTLTQTLKAQGMTYEKFRQQMRDQIIVEALRAKNISSEIIISPHKIEKYYAEHSKDYQVEDEVKLRMIVRKKSSENDPTTRKEADEIVAKLKAGASFEEMATTYSQGSQRAQGGEWGWVERPVLRKDLADVAFSLKPGQLSDVVEAKDGCYIMLVEDVKLAHVRPLSEVHAEIEKTLLVAERARLANQYIEKLKRKIFIRYL